MATDVSIIIVNWNSREYLRRCLSTLFEQRCDFSIEIIVIDSASFDGAREMVQESFPQVTFIQSETNLGFAKANNVAFEQSKGEYVLFLNPDTELIGTALAELFRQCRQLPNAGILGAKLLNNDGSVQTSCVQSFPTFLNQLLSCDYLRTKWPHSRLWGMAALFASSNIPRPVEAVSGACMFMARNVFVEVGRFSEDYFMYAEDIDLSYKSRVHGFDNYLVSSAVVTHHGGSSSSQVASDFSVVMMREATWRYLRKWKGGASAVAYRFAVVVSSGARLTLIATAMLFHRKRRNHMKQLLRKWLAVARWGFNCEETVRKYYPA
jgi:N-acetylglucosaminyl-diphospho-decaprenol L-rhamnosyltransferase